VIDGGLVLLIVILVLIDIFAHLGYLWLLVVLGSLMLAWITG
jgi:hypothetical protein